MGKNIVCEATDSLAQLLKTSPSLKNSKVHYHIHKIPLLVHTLRHIYFSNSLILY